MALKNRKANKRFVRDKRWLDGDLEAKNLRRKKRKQSKLAEIARLLKLTKT